MKHLFILPVIGLLHCFSVIAQEFSIHAHKPHIDSVWYYNVDKNSKPERMFCTQGGVQNFRLHVSGGWTQMNYLDDTITTNKKDWTEQDIRDAEAKINKEYRDQLDKMYKKDNAERIGSFEPTHEEELHGDCWDAFSDLLNSWDHEDFSLCIDDCRSQTLICEMITAHERIEGAKLGYRLVHHRSTHSAEGDDEATPPYSVEITYSLEFYSEAWVYFRIGCACLDAGVMSTDRSKDGTPIPHHMQMGRKVRNATPDTIHPPWTGISLTGERMKPGYPFYLQTPDKKFPWIPVSGGIIGAGLITYFLLPGDENTNDCSFSAGFEKTPANCNLPNGSIQVVVNQLGNYTYLWSNNQISSMLNAVPAGPYSVTITKSGTNCSKVFSTTLEQNTINFQVQLQAEDADCGLQNGKIISTVSPSGNYQYLWSTGESTTAIQNLKPGSYQLTVSAGGSCTQVVSMTIGEKTAAFTVSSQTTPEKCNNSDGKAILSVDPPGMYDYLWSNGLTGPEISGLKAGMYDATVSIRGSACSKTIQVRIEKKNSEFSVDVQTTPEYCNQSNGSATAAVNPPGNYDFLWSNGSQNAVASGLKAGTHHLSVTESGTSCLIETSVTIEHKQATHLINIQTTPAHCGLADGSAVVLVEPPGSYRIQWPDSSGAFTKNDLPAGNYPIQVFDANNCPVQGQVIVDELPAKYINTYSSSPGDCIGQHTNIRLELESPSSGPMQIDASGPNGNFKATVPKSSVNLSNYFKILPGLWLITVRDSGLKQSCYEELLIEVRDSSDFVSRPDSFRTSINKPITGNVLANDTGISLKIISHRAPVSEDFNIQGNGMFSFTPKKDSSGIFTFYYTVEDSCKKTKEQIAIIQVDSSKCDFTVKFTSAPAHCGLADGVLNVAVDSPGTYNYIWNNGNTGPSLTNARKGMYTVSITDVIKKCTLDFSASLGELPAEYLRNLRITQPRCQTPGEIRFEVFSSGAGPIKMILTHPGGSGTYTVPRGTINISSYATIVAGEFLIQLYDESAGLDCMHETSVTIEPPMSVEIILEAVIPPSSPSAADGTALIVATMPGTLPYVVLLNNLPYQTAFDHFIEVGGLGVGTYMIQLRDAANCLSNKLTVVVLPRSVSISGGYFLSIEKTKNSTIEGNKNVKPYIKYDHSVYASITYEFLKIPVSSHIIFSINPGQKTFHFEQLASLFQFQFYKFNNNFQSGFGFDFPVQSNVTSKLLLEFHSQYPVNRFLALESGIKFQSLKENPWVYKLGVRFMNPFY
ncbi:MAG: hypothetical protein IPM34_05330 [Saprospiraceae bacterium]|nr:hypothetical protein [Saprospiraceae bacterium]